MVDTTRRLYQNPPLAEAVIEFQFEENPNWDSTFLGQIRDRLPAFPELETIQSANFVIGAESLGFRRAPEGKRFWRQDRGMAVTVTPDVLAVSALPPHMPEGHRWERLRDQAFDILEVYRGVASPGPVRRIGLRYINAVPVAPGEFTLRDWVTEGSGLVPDVLSGEANPFSLRMERVVGTAEEYQRREILTLATQMHPDHGWRLMLDVDEVALWSREPEQDGLRLVFEDMHDAVHAVFVRLVRPDVLESFGPIELPH